MYCAVVLDLGCYVIDLPRYSLGVAKSKAVGIPQGPPTGPENKDEQESVFDYLQHPSLTCWSYDFLGNLEAKVVRLKAGIPPRDHGRTVAAR